MVLINGKKTTLQVDSGADVNVITYHQCKQLGFENLITKSKERL